MTKFEIEWPAIYLRVSNDEELMFVSSDDWNHDVDAKFAIGPINGEKDHYFVDSGENVYRISSLSKAEAGYPNFQFEKVNDTKVLDLVKARAKKQLGVVPDEFSRLVWELNY